METQVFTSCKEYDTQQSILDSLVDGVGVGVGVGWDESTS